MEYTSKQIISRVVREYLRPRLKQILLAIFFMVLFAASNAAQPIILQQVVDKMLSGNSSAFTAALPLAIMAAFIALGVSSFGSNYVMSAVGFGVVNDMQKKLFNHFINSDIEFHNNLSSGELISRLMHDIAQIRTAVSMVIIGFFKQLLTLSAYVVIMFYMNWELTLIALSVMAVTIYPMQRASKRLKKLAKENQNYLAILTTKLSESFKGIGVVKAYQLEGNERDRVNKLVDKTLENRLKTVRVSNLYSPLMLSLAGAAISAVLWFSSWQIQHGLTTSGKVMAFIATLLMASRPIKGIGGTSGVVSSAVVSAERYFAMIDKPALIKDAENATELKISAGNIKFEDVNFSYLDGTKAIKNISIEVPTGKKVALVGPSGGGKSTIMSLVLRFFDPQSGKILIDSQDTKQVTIKSLRQSIALVNQDIFLFDDSVANNIAFGKMGASQESIEAAAKAASAHDFIMQLPQGYNTIIGEDGVKLSGGQKQRLSIARAILKNAPILLLDEATSSLDNVSENEIQKALDKLMEGKTTLVIAHRLSTIINADLIYVIESGQVIDKGTHNELLERSAIYRKLYNSEIAK